MEVGFHALAFRVERVDLVAAAVHLDAPHLPALRLQPGDELVLRLLAVLAAGLAGREAGRVRRRCGGEKREGRRCEDGGSDAMAGHAEFLYE